MPASSQQRAARSGRTDAGSRPGRPGRAPPRSSSTTGSPGGMARSRNRQMRSPSSVLTSSPTITVSPAGAISRASSATSIRSWSVIARWVSPRSTAARSMSVGCGQRIEAATCGSADRRTRAVAGAPRHPPSSVGPRQTCWTQRLLEEVEVLQRETGAEGHAVERVLGDVAGHAGDLGQQLVDVAQQRAAARHDHALVDDVRRRARAASARGRSGPRRPAAGAAPRSPP